MASLFTLDEYSIALSSIRLTPDCSYGLYDARAHVGILNLHQLAADETFEVITQSCIISRSDCFEQIMKSSSA